MEYTNDVIFNVRYKKDEINSIAYNKHRIIKRIVNWIKKDDYFCLVLFVSTSTIIIDFLMVKHFIEILKLL